MKELLEFLIQSLVQHPDEVVITETISEDGMCKYSVHVNNEDMGRIIGRGGKTARAIRLLISAKASMDGKRSRIDIEDEEERNAGREEDEAK